MGFSAVNTGNNLLFLVVSGLLAFMSVTGLAGMLNIRNLVPELIPPEEIFAGIATPFRLRIQNHKRFMPSFLIRVECSNGQGATIPLVPRGGQAEGDVVLTFGRRGAATIGKITISSPFPVSFFTRFWTFTMEKGLVVFPRLIQGRADGLGQENKRVGNSIHQSRGLDGELERIAGYTGTQPLRNIHWKLSARSAELLVKEFGKQTSTPLIIDLENLPGIDLEERVSRAAGLVRRWVQVRPVGIRLGKQIIPPEAGRRHGHLLLTELAFHGLD
ncbi:MAG TPA: DUF58 domain-containing protein [Desulfuromonadaceae bacterium]